MCEFISIILAHGRQGWPRKKMVPAGSNQQVIMYSVRECTAGLSILVLSITSYYYYYPNLENWCVMFNLQGSVQLGNTETVVFLL